MTRHAVELVAPLKLRGCVWSGRQSLFASIHLDPTAPGFQSQSIKVYLRRLGIQTQLRSDTLLTPNRHSITYIHQSWETGPREYPVPSILTMVADLSYQAQHPSKETNPPWIPTLESTGELLHTLRAIIISRHQCKPTAVLVPLSPAHHAFPSS